MNKIVKNIKRSSGFLTDQDLKDAYQYFDGLCPYSETPINYNECHLEHIIPVIMGGTTDSWNCIPVCSPCNLSKGGKHLLDWWDLEHKVEEEYKLEKIFNYMVEQLNKPRNYQITTTNQQFISKLLKEEKEIENQSEDIIYSDEDKINLDTFTFLYQLLNHLISNKQYIKGDIQKYIQMLQETYDNNSQYERIDTELFLLQSNLVKYLKSIGVIQHYNIAFTYSHKITDLNEVKNNIDGIKKYLQTDNISELINKNPEIILMDEVEFSSRLEYLVNILNIPLNTFLEKPIIINQLENLKELYEYCINENIDFNNIPNHVFATKIIRDIQKIIDVCNTNRIEITGNVFRQSAEEIQKIVDVCNTNRIEITGSVFYQSAEEIQKIVDVCNINRIEITGSVFLKSAEEVQRIIEVCKRNGIEITGSVFYKKSQDLNETINYIKQNYNDEYLKPLLIVVSVKKLKEVFPYLESLGVLPTVINSASILTFSLDEIIERKSVLDYLGEPMVVGERYNSIFGLSRKNYQKKLESLNVVNYKNR